MTKLQVTSLQGLRVIAASSDDATYLAARLPEAAALPGICRRWVAVAGDGRRLGCAVLALDGLGYWTDLASQGGEVVAGALNDEVLKAARARGARKVLVRAARAADDPQTAAWIARGYAERVEVQRWRIEIEPALRFATDFSRRLAVPAGAVVSGMEPALISRVAAMRRNSLGGDGPSIDRLLRDSGVPDAYTAKLCRVALAGDRIAAIWLARNLDAASAYVESMVVAKRYRSEWPGPLIVRAGLESAARAGKRFLEAETARRNGLLTNGRGRVGVELIATKLQLFRSLPGSADDAQLGAISRNRPVIALIGFPAAKLQPVREILHELGYADSPGTADGWLRRIPNQTVYWEAARGGLVMLVPALAAGVPRLKWIVRITAKDEGFVLVGPQSGSVLRSNADSTNELLTDAVGLRKRLIVLLKYFEPGFPI